jgi:hypothetical protein
MKTYNNHPQWHNQPLRLSKKDIHNPHRVFEDFFDNYHLQDVRHITWKWLAAVISSPGSISDDPLERSNDIFFYEKIEKLIEAALVIHRRARSKSKKSFR